MSRFDYVAYDYTATQLQARFKTLVQQVEGNLGKYEIDQIVTELGHLAAGLGKVGRPVALALIKMREFHNVMDSIRAEDTDAEKADFHERAIDKLEEFYMWVGKAIRDDQIKRNGSAPLQEGRKDG